MTTKITLKKPELKKGDNGHVYLSSQIRSELGDSLLWIRSREPTAQHFDAKVADAFVLPALLLAMESGSDLYIDADVSDLLFLNAKNQIAQILKIQNPRLRVPAITARGTTTNRKEPIGVGTGLSCGIDSFAAVYTHLISNPPASTRLTHFAQFNHAQLRGDERGWAVKMPRYRRVAADLGLPLIEIGTNFSAMIKAPHTMSHTYLNNSCAIALDGLLSKYFYASTFQYRDVFINQTSDIAHADPVVLPLISNENIRFFCTGSETPRTAKTALVAKVDASYAALEVCTKNPSEKLNCSACYKCLRTLCTLDLLGEIEKYAAVFDLEKWRRQKRGYARKVLNSFDNPYMTEIRELPGAEKKLLIWAGRTFVRKPGPVIGSGPIIESSTSPPQSHE